MSNPQSGPASGLPVVAGPASEAPARGRGPRRQGASAYAAQVLGEGGARRGLRGGAPVLNEAQHAYLETEWSGPSDRRTPVGITRREKV